MTKLKSCSLFIALAVVGVVSLNPGVGAEQEPVMQYQAKTCAPIEQLEKEGKELPAITEDNKVLVNETSDTRQFCESVDYVKRNNEGVPEKYHLDYAYIIGTIEGNK